MNYILVFIVSYLIGTFHLSYILGKKVKKIDIRTQGSNNSGASNTVLLLGWKYGLAVALVDMIKGLIATLIAKYIFSGDMNLICFAGVSVVLGHMYPFHMKFCGGKGLATFVGMMHIINPWVSVFCGVSVLIVAYISNYIVIGTVFACIIFSIYSLCRFGFGITFCMALFVSSLIVVKHRVNFKRIVNKEEAKFRDSLKKKN